MLSIHAVLDSIAEIAKELRSKSYSELADYAKELRGIDDTLDSIRMSIEEPIE